MILLDFNHIAVRNIAAVAPSLRGEPLTIDFVRHVVFATLGDARSNFKNKYEELVIACDHHGKSGYWRKNLFPYYKAKRKDARDKGPQYLDWPLIFKFMDQIKEDLRTWFPYPVLEVEGCEADDIIAILSQNLIGQHLIYSSDEDFTQLVGPKVHQYSPHRRALIEPSFIQAQNFLIEHIIEGDAGDGVPNILSDDDTFVNPDKRQAVMTSKRMELLKSVEPRAYISIADKLKCPNLVANYERNKKLIDLSEIPVEWKDKILEQWQAIQKQPRPPRVGAFQFFTQNGLRIHAENANIFV